MTPDTFVCYLGGIGLAIVLTVAACVVARRDPDGKGVIISRVLSVLLLAKGALWFYTIFTDGPWHASYGLPLYLCDFAVFVAAAACWWRSPLLVEVTYFWALAGVVQALITPDLPRTLSHLLVFQYTFGHLAVVAAAIYLVVGLKVYPRRLATVRVYLVTLLFTAVTGLVDWKTGGNYMFLQRTPHSWSILNLFGPWPWYIVVAGLVAAVFFLILNLPFWWMRRGQIEGPGQTVTTVVGVTTHRTG
ncbi:TIGR02206 family membrane protein [Ferrimicrobium sp.]|uniref:YwaF family protein n=1 Tax=Ferrimicrobium sp. TaxID=2926050 RepID=UPI0026257542|nr:TIGR02206 family membrane protein [Ferrimicrobium sp.]